MLELDEKPKQLPPASTPPIIGRPVAGLITFQESWKSSAECNDPASGSPLGEKFLYLIAHPIMMKKIKKRKCQTLGVYPFDIFSKKWLICS
jgi:hypothetical protein